MAKPPREGKRSFRGEVTCDSDLVLEARGGDNEAFRKLVERYTKKAYWTAYNMVYDHGEAQDIAQEAFIRVYRFMDRYDPKQEFGKWLYQIVTNLSIDNLRRRKGSRAGTVRTGTAEDMSRVEANQPGPFQRAQLTEKQEKVQEILKGLPFRYRVIVVLRDIEGFPSREVAKLVGINHATVRWRLHRGRSLFKQAWERRYGSEET